MNEFFDNYEKSAAGLLLQNIFNCDETNLQAGVHIFSWQLSAKSLGMWGGGGDYGRYQKGFQTKKIDT